MHVTHVFPIFVVPDLDEAIAYYRDRLGFDIAWTWGEPALRAGVRLDDIEIQLVSESPHAPPGPAVVYCHMVGVDEYHRACRDRGATIFMELGERPWGMRDFRVLDPGGNRLGFGSPI